jgi:hypothetical protein
MQNIFGAGSMWGTPLTDATGTAVVNPTPVQFGVAQEIGVDIAFDTKLLYGQQQFPVAAGRGKGKIGGKIKNAMLYGFLLNSVVFGQTMTNSIVDDFYDTTGMAIPTTPFTITGSTSAPTASTFQIPSSGVWAADLGVKNAAGLPMKRVASAPASGQYTVAAGVYVFAAADVGLIVYISYQYTAASATANKSTVQNVVMGYAPTFRCDISLPYNGRKLVFTFPSCIASKLSLATKLDDFAVPEINFDAFADPSGNVLTYALTE